MTGVANITELPIGQRAHLAVLLAGSDLPNSDIDTTQGLFWQFSDKHGDIGFAGLEIDGSDALLRSVVVAAERRGQGHGRAIVEWIQDRAAINGVRRLFLMTTSAADFFSTLGFKSIDRSLVPAGTQSTAEFATLCPATAICMTKVLGRPS